MDDVIKIKLVKSAIQSGEYPRYLYKYRDLGANTKKSIANAKFWFAQPSTFNDPFDCNLSEVPVHKLKDFKSYLKHQKLENGMSDQEEVDYLKKFKKSPSWARNMAIETRNRVLDTYGIFSLSKVHDNILMWSHYADDHQGVVLKFDLLESIEFFLGLVNVKYQDSYTQLNYYSEHDRLDSLNRNVTIKSKLWEYEEEMRVIKNKNGLISVNRSAIKEVYFGCKTSEVEIKNMKLLFTKSGYTGLKYFKGHISHGLFKLGFTKT